MEHRIQLVKIGEVAPPAVPLELEEDWDADALAFVQKSGMEVFWPERAGDKEKEREFGAFKKACKAFDGSVTYALIPDVAPCGRLYASYSRGLQAAPKFARALLCGGRYIETDISNCQPAILHQLARAKGWACQAMGQYVAQRDALLTDMAAAASKTVADMKAAVIALYFGAGKRKLIAMGLPEGGFAIQRLLPEVAAAREAMMKDSEFAALKAKLSARKGMGDGKLPRSLAAHVLQTQERLAMEALVHELTDRGYDVMTYIHDGLLVKGLSEPLPEEVLEACSARIAADTGLELRCGSKVVEPPAAILEAFAAFKASRSPARKKKRAGTAAGAGAAAADSDSEAEFINDIYAARTFAELLGDGIVNDRNNVWVFDSNTGLWSSSEATINGWSRRTRPPCASSRWTPRGR